MTEVSLLTGGIFRYASGSVARDRVGKKRRREVEYQEEEKKKKKKKTAILKTERREERKGRYRDRERSETERRDSMSYYDVDAILTDSQRETAGSGAGYQEEEIDET
ncbi:hypothetical protein TRV_04676 [Trichophyton verrucosum HKI 0517]|uniref:Uncharacterized protein n=1 Tax=Trichophyton verrucosum (strain HKI 0517) TaxID=663202 RepID=D4DC24_TRIVH|nr:uncharacterized protein TRV_04676 [Trichophyton verrucosum HKI 0517]EFE40626.1 hypothetical protein TRV_04676 [Trichophyton verrucosum HKI 0517]